MAHLTYSAGGKCESYHEEIARFDFPKGQKTYGLVWDLIADELAADYHDNHDGWEASWPLELRIYSDGQEVARFEVEKEIVPHFSAWAVEKTQQVQP